MNGNFPILGFEGDLAFVLRAKEEGENSDDIFQ